MNYVHYVSETTVEISYLLCLVINVNLSCIVDVFANFPSLFATMLVVIRSIINNDIPDRKLTMFGRLFEANAGSVTKMTPIFLLSIKIWKLNLMPLMK